MKRHLLFILAISLLMFSCREPKSGELRIEIDYSVNGQDIEVDKLQYHNEAGNTFLITEIQWFISRIQLQNDHDEWIDFTTEDNIFYIDTDITSSHLIKTTTLAVGHYKALRFTFGLNEEDNRSFRFVNPPESNMFWPEHMGGGYHYMKLNGKYQNEDSILAPMNIHLGIGQNSDFSEFFHNYFVVEQPLDVVITENDITLKLTMIVDNWFRSPHTYDICEWGSAIMQNQEAQNVLKENGHDVFIITK